MILAGSCQSFRSAEMTCRDIEQWKPRAPAARALKVEHRELEIKCEETSHSFLHRESTVMQFNSSLGLRVAIGLQ